MSVSPLLRRAAAAPPPSPYRAALADAIAARDAGRTRISNLRGAIGRAVIAIREAREERGQATRTADQARAADAAETTRALIADAEAPPATLPRARREQQDAEDALAAAETARDSINAEIAELERGAQLRDMAVDDAAVAVLRAETGPAVARLVAELDGLHQRTVDLGRTLDALIAANAVITGGEACTTLAATVSNRFEVPPASWEIARDVSPCPTPVADVWASALAALKADAAAPLPA